MAEGMRKAAHRQIWMLYCGDATHKFSNPYADTDSTLVARLTAAAS